MSLSSFLFLLSPSFVPRYQLASRLLTLLPRLVPTIPNANKREFLFCNRCIRPSILPDPDPHPDSDPDPATARGALESTELVPGVPIRSISTTYPSSTSRVVPFGSAEADPAGHPSQHRQAHFKLPIPFFFSSSSAPPPSFSNSHAAPTPGRLRWIGFGCFLPVPPFSTYA